MCVSTINKIQLINMNFASDKKKEVGGKDWIEGDAIVSLLKITK